MSNTPRTDQNEFSAATITVNMPPASARFCHAVFARDIERERNRWEMESSLNSIIAKDAIDLAESVMKHRDKLSEQLFAVTDQCDKLAEALRFYADISKYPVPLTGGMGALYFDCGGRASEALAAVKGVDP